MTDTDYASLNGQPIQTIRPHIRSGAYTGHTAGFAPGRLQANLAILGDGFADDFHEFCLKNSQPCPLVGMSGRGDPMMHSLGDIDIRTDVPSYNVYRDGALADTVPDITELWTEDMVAFALGCSFTFERALAEAGIRMKHIEANLTVPMFATNIPLKGVGPFQGNMVVSMRPVQRELVDLATRITDGYGHAHGAPVHSGDPEKSGSAISVGPTGATRSTSILVMSRSSGPVASRLKTFCAPHARRSASRTRPGACWLPTGTRPTGMC